MSITRMKGRTEMRWIPIGRKAFAEIQSEATETVTDEYEGITLYFGETISAIRRMGERLYMYETNFREAIQEVDVTELQEGDVIWYCLNDGPVRAHRPHVEYPNTEMVFWHSGMKDAFGSPQKLEVLRGGQFA